MKPSKIISGLLALLGFGITAIGCGGKMYAPPPPDEYGSPHADFEIKGRVMDEAGEPVEDIKVVIQDDEWGDPEHPLAVGITDADGRYDIDGGWFGDDNLTVAVEDIDGDDNGGEFAAQEKKIKIDKGDYVGGKGWFRGKVTKTADFELELKPQDNETE